MTQDIKAYLTNPYPNDGDDKIHRIYHELFKGIQPNSTVRAAFYMWHVKDNSSDSSPRKIADELVSKVRNLSVDAQLLFDKDFAETKPLDIQDWLAIKGMLDELATETTDRWAGGLPDGIVYHPSSDKYSIFKSDQYVQHSHGDAPDFSPKSLIPLSGIGAWSGWPISWPYGNVDSVAYYEPKDRYYLFKGNEYARHSHNSGLDSGYPKKIQENWSGWPDSWGSGNVDAVVYYPPKKCWYLFKDDEYVRHKHTNGPDDDYPKKISGNWSGWPDSWGSGRVDGVVWHPKAAQGWWWWNWLPWVTTESTEGDFYLLKGNEYVRHAFGEAKDAGYPKSITNVWSGWPSGVAKTSPLAFDAVPNKSAGLELVGSPKMHNKTMLFSELQFNNPPTFDKQTWPSSMKYVVVESSANIWTSQYRQANQLILTYGHRELYEDALRRFKNILHQKNNEGEDDIFPAFAPLEKNYTMFQTNDIKVYGFPRSKDLIVSILNNIDLHYEKPDCKQPHIRIMASGFTRKKIAEKLKKLKEIYGEGLTIEVISRGNIASAVENILDNNIDLLKIDPDLPNGDNIKIHSKVLMYEGQYMIGGESQWCKLVWCGAHNYTKPALDTNSETLWRIKKDSVYDAHVANFEAIKSCLESTMS